ncbi:hypothetical protein TNCV_9991 [Trichonephila clavipes]|nr:hypothetical protein TNCV_9991 [Trichonephila clavipes]
MEHRTLSQLESETHSEDDLRECFEETVASEYFLQDNERPYPREDNTSHTTTESLQCFTIGTRHSTRNASAGFLSDEHTPMWSGIM